MPPHRAFCAVGRVELYAALCRYYSLPLVASTLGLAYRKGPSGERYRGPALQSFAQVRSQLAALADAGVCAPGSVPSRKQLVDAGQLPLYNRLTALCGGMPALAQKLRLSFSGRRMSRSVDVAPSMTDDALLSELRGVWLATGRAGRVPSRRVLRELGRPELAAAIAERGGPQAAATALGLASDRRGRPRGRESL